MLNKNRNAKLLKINRKITVENLENKLRPDFGKTASSKCDYL